MSSFTTILLCAFAPETYLQFHNHNYSSLRFCTWNLYSVSQLFFSELLYLKFIFRFTTILLCAFAPETYVQFHNYSSLRFCTWNICPVSQLCFGNLRFCNYLSILSLLSPLFFFTTMFHLFVSFFLCLFPSVFHSFFFQTFSTVFRALSLSLSLGATLLSFLLLVTTIYRASNVRPAVSEVRFRLSLGLSNRLSVPPPENFRTGSCRL
jgi:hypothetical protein